MSGHQLFLVTLNLRSKICRNFLIYRALWTLNFWLREGGGSGQKLFLLTLNLKSKFFWNFLIYRVLCTLNFSQGGIWAPSFFGHAKLEVKNFLEFFYLQSTLDSEFFTGRGSGYQLFLVMLNLRSKNCLNFLIYRALWSLDFLLGRGGSVHQLFLVTLNFRLKVFGNFFIYRALWTRGFSLGEGTGVSG